MTVVIVDNNDSFTYNIAQYVQAGGARTVVLPNSTPVGRLAAQRPSHLILSPGPGTVLDGAATGVCFDALAALAGRVPVLGVCLGHQVIARYYGAGIRRSAVVRHGRVSPLRRIRPARLLRGVPERFPAMRYHSLVVDPDTVAALTVTCVAEDDGAVMAVEHPTLPVFGVQFHPESVGTPHGMRLIRNFLATGPSPPGRDLESA